MANPKRNQLIKLGAEALADAILSICDTSLEADNVVKRLLATPEQNIKRYKEKLTSLKRGHNFISWQESSAFVSQLQQLLGDLEAGAVDPCMGVGLVGRFFEADAYIFERCDDSNGNIGDVFRYTAADLFVAFASQCGDKQNIADLVIQLNQKDDYGIRDCLFERCSEFLPESALRAMLEQLLVTTQHENPRQQRGSWGYAAQMLARQLKDAPLFEKVRLGTGGPSAAAWVDIAKVYLECGEPEIALSRLKDIPENETYMSGEYQQLQLAIYHQLGDREAETEMAWQIFKGRRSQATLIQLLDVIGHDHQKTVVDDEIRVIFQEPRLSYADADFLLKTRRIDALETYLSERIDQLDGNLYYSLLPLAESLEGNGRPLVGSLIYRVLLDSILARAVSKYYHHGVKYLRRLDRLAASVEDWKNWPSHSVYLTALHEQNKRKIAFWTKYQAGD